MKKSYIMWISYILIPVLIAIVFADIAGFFSYRDLPFLLFFFLYGLCIAIQRSTSAVSFGLTLGFLVWMGLSYSPTGASQTTERIGVWFYLSFLFSILQCLQEKRKLK